MAKDFVVDGGDGARQNSWATESEEREGDFDSFLMVLESRITSSTITTFHYNLTEMIN